jgi:putative flippase GtrA
MVGAGCALLHNAVMIGADYAGLHYAISLMISFLLVGGVGYLLHVLYTFKGTLSAVGFVKYVIPMAANIPIALAGLFLLCDVAKLPVAVAAPMLTVFTFALNYMFSRWAILGRRERQ